MSKARQKRGRPRESFQSRFDKLITVKFQMPGKLYEKLDPCIILPGTAHHRGGRPGMWDSELQKFVYLARWVYMITHGLTLAFLKNAGDMVVAHSCDNPRCFNPNHLTLETHRGNINAAVDRQRYNYVFYKDQFLWVMVQYFILKKTVEDIFQTASWHTLFAKRGMYRRGVLHQPGFNTFYELISGQTQGWKKARKEFFKKYAKKLPGGDPYQ